MRTNTNSEKTDYWPLVGGDWVGVKESMKMYLLEQG